VQSQRRRRPTLFGRRLFFLAVSAAAVAAHAQAPGAGSFAAQLELRAREVEVAAAIAGDGRLLYLADDSKKSWGQYCAAVYPLMEAGRVREAVRSASKAFFLGQRGNDPIALSMSARDLAYAFSAAGDLDAAWKWSGEAIAHYAKIGYTRVNTDHSILSPVHKVRGDIEVRRGRYAEALKEYAVALDKVSGFGTDRPFIRVAQGNAMLRGGQADKAREAFEDLRSASEPAVRAAAIRGLAELAIRARRSDEARQLLSAAVNEATEAKAGYAEMWFRYDLARTLLDAGDRKGAGGQLAIALRLADALRGKFRSEEFKTGFFADVQQVFDLAVTLAMEDGRHAEAFEISEASRARALADVIRGRDRSGRAAEAARAARAGEISALLPENTALVAYHVLDTRTAAWIVRRDGLEGRWLELGGAQLADEVRALRRSIVALASVEERARALHARLVAPLGLRTGETLLVAPHRALHFLPFQALRGAGGWLVEERPLAYVPSGSALGALVLRASVPGGALLALGNPTLPVGDLPPLPGAEAEVERIAGAFPQKATYLRGEATKGRFVAEAPASAVVHVAAHAEVDEIDPMYSRIRLAGENRAFADLEAHEFYGMDLSRVRLVALSACDSGLGRVSGGDEFWGFKRTLLSAGVRSLLVSLWPVADASTPALMEKFYAPRAPGASAAAAMRDAQVALIRSPKYGHPMFWAAFNLEGDWR